MNFEITELSDFSGEMAHIYSVTLRGEEQTLLEQFFDDNAEYEAELATIVEKLMVMGNDTGCRYEFSSIMKVLLPMVWLHCALARSGSIASISTAQLCSSALEDTNRQR